MNFKKLLYQCLRQRLRRIGVGYNGEENIYYFWSSRDLSKREARYRHHSGSKHHHTVFRGYLEHSQEPEEVNFYRHRSFRGSFRRIEESWYLEITPTYYFTTDGHEPHPGGGKLASNVKRFEKHESVRNQVEFWGHQLRRTDFNSSYPHLKFGPLKTFTIDHGIDDQHWRDSGSVEEEPEPEEADASQHDLFDQ